LPNERRKTNKCEVNVVGPINPLVIVTYGPQHSRDQKLHISISSYLVIYIFHSQIVSLFGIQHYPKQRKRKEGRIANPNT
jgi:hypothetical protein